jgi:Zn-finger nucleic acid-binding protein
MLCPCCTSKLEEREDSDLSVTFLSCPSGCGKAVQEESYSGKLNPSVIKEVLNASLTQPKSKTCPSCGSSMHARVFDPDSLNLELDICPSCNLIWFDAFELTLFKKATLKEHKEHLKTKVKELIVQHKNETALRIEKYEEKASKFREFTNAFGRIVYGRYWL